MQKILMGLVVCGLFVAAAVSVIGCQPSGQTAKVMVLLAGDNGLPEKANEVAVADIQSLTVTVTQIVLDSGQNAGEGEGEGEGEQDSGSKVVVFSGEKTIDIRDLTDISALISSMEIPAGMYTKIRLTVKDPVLVLVSDPSTSITDIQMTANSRLFVSKSFDIPEGQASLVLLDFNGIHLQSTGNGKYVWTPQLRADVSVVPADVQAAGTIASVDATTQTFALDADSVDSLIQVGYADAAIYLPADVDTATGSSADLTVGATVQVEGLLNVEGDVTAETVRLVTVSP